MIFHILNGLGVVLGSAGVVLGGPIAFYLSAPHKILIAPPYFKGFPKTRWVNFSQQFLRTWQQGRAEG